MTTELLGMDGLPYAPASPDKLEQLLYYLAAVNGTPPPDVRWGSVREYLDLFDNRVACNVAFMAPTPPSGSRLWGGTTACPPSRN